MMLVRSPIFAKHFLPILAKKTISVFAVMSARVGSISDNRLGGWYSYRASKAALNMIIKSLSIEFERTHKKSIIVGLEIACFIAFSVIS